MTGNTNGNRIEHGQYVDFERLEDGRLKVILNDEGKALLRGDLEPEELRDLAEYEYPVDFSELIEDFTCNGWDWVSAEECGALTGNDTMITDWKSVDDHGTIEYIGDIWYYNYYAIRNPVEELDREGYIILDVEKADEEENPTVTCEFVEDFSHERWVCGRKVYKSVAKQGHSGMWFCLEHARAMGVA